MCIRDSYDFAANLCQKQELQAMAFIFQATAKQEQAHAKVFGGGETTCDGKKKMYELLNEQIGRAHV